ncbi:hypothetical protein NL676_033979 [Syzygium grande]|nr:hypothetical protein NL676_033979 [Syzygium grande]
MAEANCSARVLNGHIFLPDGRRNRQINSRLSCHTHQKPGVAFEDRVVILVTTIEYRGGFRYGCTAIAIADTVTTGALGIRVRIVKPIASLEYRSGTQFQHYSNCNDGRRNNRCPRRGARRCRGSRSPRAQTQIKPAESFRLWRALAWQGTRRRNAAEM